MEKKYTCICCETPNIITEEGMFEICPVCGWEDDNLQRKYPDEDLTVNPLSLKEAKKKWKETGKRLF